MKTSSPVSFHPKRGTHAALLITILILVILSSVSSVAAISQYKLLSHTMCKNVTQKGVCVNEAHIFDASDKAAFVWFKIKAEETGTVTANEKWYYQTDSVEHSGNWEPKVAKGEAWYFWSHISISDDKADLRGFWRAEIYIEGQFAFAEEFTIGPYYQVQISVTGDPETTSVPIRIDGEAYGELKGGQSKKLGFAPGTSHELSVQKEIATKEGVRWVTQEDAWQFSGEGSHTFTYEEQYQLSIETAPVGAVTIAGAGWYSKGAAVNIGQIPEVVNVDSGTKLVRKSISVDKQEVATPPTSITMDKPHTVRIQYQKQYHLKVISDYGNPQGEGWYDDGAKATFSVESPSPQAGVLGLLGGRMVFKAWTGDSSSTSVSASIQMNGPKTVTAKWTTDNTLLYVVIGAIVAVVLIVALLLVRRRKKASPSPAHGPVSVPAVAVPSVPATPAAPPPAPPSGTSAPGVKFCISCGATLPVSVNFCNKCGSKQ